MYIYKRKRKAFYKWYTLTDDINNHSNIHTHVKKNRVKQK